MNRFGRLFYSIVLQLFPGGGYRIAAYIKKHHLYGGVGDGCLIQTRIMPLYSNLVFIHNNVIIASDVRFVTHDSIHAMLNHKFGKNKFIERVGCIEIMDNVFIGSGTRILYGVRIGSNVIVGSDSLVNKDIPDNSVYAGVPVKYICSFDEYVQKAEKYSTDFKARYGKDKLTDVDSLLAKELYQYFQEEHQ